MWLPVFLANFLRYKSYFGGGGGERVKVRIAGVELVLASFFLFEKNLILSPGVYKHEYIMGVCYLLIREAQIALIS